MKTAEQFVNEECAVYNAEALVAAMKARDVQVKAASWREASRLFEPQFWAAHELQRLATALDGIASDGLPSDLTAERFRAAYPALQPAPVAPGTTGFDPPAPGELGFRPGADAPQLSVPAEPRDMTDAETAAHLREYVKQQHSTFSWPTDTCGYDQHIRFVEHRNKNWQAAHDGGETFDQFVLAYADSLDPPAAPPAGTGRRDPRDKAGCACPRIDGRRCIEFRSSPTAQLDFDEECECWCHDIYERNLREAEEDESECDECGAITKERE